MQNLPSDLAKTRKFQPPTEDVTAPFVRVIDDATVRFSRPYERVELEPNPAESLVERVELDLSTVRPICDDTVPFSFDPIETSDPYALIEVRISVPAVAQPLVVRPTPIAQSRIPVFFVVAAVLVSAFACGVGVAFAL